MLVQQIACPGQLLGNTYLLEHPLGEGGMGLVFRARHLRTGGAVAIKVLQAAASQNQVTLHRFQREARLGSILRHPNIVQVMDTDQMPDGSTYLVMELLDGEDLSQYLAREGTLPYLGALELARQVGSALSAAHLAGVIHRDIKPHNLFLLRSHPSDGRYLFKVVDFGIAKLIQETCHTGEMLLGSPLYMAPEAAEGRNQDLDPRADQFSLAAVLYCALAGRPPFEGASLPNVLYQIVHAEPLPLRSLAPFVPDHAAAAIHRALAKRRDDRFPTIDAFVQTLLGTKLQPITTSRQAGRHLLAGTFLGAAAVSALLWGTSGKSGGSPPLPAPVQGPACPLPQPQVQTAPRLRAAAPETPRPISAGSGRTARPPAQRPAKAPRYSGERKPERVSIEDI